MSFDLTWEIGVLLNDYANRVKLLETKDFDHEIYKQKEALEELYAQAIELNCKKGYGLIMPIDDFIDMVKNTSINDYDGMGDLLDKNGEETGSVRCSVSFLKEAKDNGVYFVAWYNK